MTLVPAKSKGSQKPCQEVQIILGAPGGDMMEYSLRAKRDSFHHIIPFKAGYHRYGFSVHLTATDRSKVLPIIRPDSEMLMTTVKWFQVNKRRNVAPVDEDRFEQRDYQATRFVHAEHFCVAVITNPPPIFELGGVYIPENYSVNREEYDNIDEVTYAFKAKFYFKPHGQWHVYGTRFDNRDAE